MTTFREIEDFSVPTSMNPSISLSESYQRAIKSPDFGANPFLTSNDVDMASVDPVNRVYGIQDLDTITSDTGTIAWDTFRKGILDLASLPEKAQMALGNTLSGISGGTIGVEMRDRAADKLMKTMEESRFLDSNYGDAETWTAKFTGGAMSMAEMLAIGAATGAVGLGAFVGTTSLSDGALNDMAKYVQEHENLDGYETDPLNLALDYGNAVFQIASEMMFGTGRLINGKVLKAGSRLGAFAKEAVDNALQEGVQGAASDFTEVLKGNEDIDILADNFGDYVKDAVVGGVLGGGIGGVYYHFNKGRAKRNIEQIVQTVSPEKTPAEAEKIAETVWRETESKAMKSFAPELIAQLEATNDKGKIRDNVREKVATMFADADMSEKERAAAIEATTTLELENMLYDSLERKVPLSRHPILQGMVNELGWFRAGIPEHRRAEINVLNDEFVQLQTQLKDLNSVEQKNYAKIEEIEAKIEQFQKTLPEKISDLARTDKAEIANMLNEQRMRVSKMRQLREIERKSRSAAIKQDEENNNLAAAMATGAEKARERRIKQETEKQTKEAKIRSLTEQRDINRAIKQVKQSIREMKVNNKLAPAMDGTQIDENEEVMFQSAMYASPKTDIVEFYNQVMENQAPKYKPYFRHDVGDISVRVPFDTIRHDINKHGMSAKDWQLLLNSIDNIEKAVIDPDDVNKYGQNARLKVRSGDIVYGVMISPDGYITTAFNTNERQTTEKSIDAWLDKKTAKRSDKNPTIMLGRSLYDIINQLKSNVKSEDEIQAQGRISGQGDVYRGAYIPQYRFIAKTANMDVSTLAHELAHDWGQEYFRWARSRHASEDFIRSWGAVEKAIGITAKDTYFTYDASEKFARAYEGWLLQKKDWEKILRINTPEERAAVEEYMEDYRQSLVDIYENLIDSAKYFDRTFGKVGELKPEFVEFFERANKFGLLEAQVKRGEISEDQAAEQKLNQMVEAANNASIETMSMQDKERSDAIKAIEILNEKAKRFEKEGGNTNRLQQRLDKIALAKGITENNAVLGKYDTHRDMIAVAEAADLFVQTRETDALAIINGQMAEQDGLFASDIYTALERKAQAENNYPLIEELRNSKVAQEIAKELGQRIAGFRNFKADGNIDIVSALNALDKIYTKGINSQVKEQLELDLNEYFSDLIAQDKTLDSKLDEFLQEMECK